MSKTDDDEQAQLEQHQLALVHFQQHAIKAGEKVLVIFEGRDAAGKDGTIRRVTEHLSVRSTEVVALPKPTEEEKTQWYFQRHVPHLPAGGQLMIFNRSWYNRAGVERVMGFCTPEQVEAFLRDVPVFEDMLQRSGVRLLKFWLDVSKKEQAKRLEERRTDPLKVLKSSPLDAAAQDKWDDYSKARDEMLRRSHSEVSPWICVRGDHKKAARLNVIRHLVHALAPGKIATETPPPDPAVAFPFEIAALTDGRLER